MVLNLAGNAVKFTEEGEVIVRVAVEERRGSEAVLHFSVSDTGIGIPADKLDQVFAPFEQVDGSTTRKYGGTGLGLPISLRLVGMMKGRLWAESAVGKGSTFHFTAVFGLCSAHARLDVGELADQAGLPALVIDDNATNRRILEGLLRGWDMRPTSAASGAAGLAELRRAARDGVPYRLILLDVMMPEMDGFAVTEEIKRLPSLVDTTILMLSSADSKDDAARCRRLGVACYLVKPIKPSELFNAILVALSRKPRCSPVARKMEEAAPLPPATTAPSRRPPRPSCRGQCRQPEARCPPHRETGPQRGRCQQRPRGGYPLAARVVRRDLDGCTNARDERLRGHGRYPGRRRAVRADYRDDGRRHERRPRALSRGGYERLCIQAGSGWGTLGGGGPIAEGLPLLRGRPGPHILIGVDPKGRKEVTSLLFYYPGSLYARDS